MLDADKTLASYFTEYNEYHAVASERVMIFTQLYMACKAKTKR
jgi:hypothetical protein